MSDNREFLDRFPPTMLVLVAVVLWSLGGLLFKLTDVTGFEANLGRCLFAAVTMLLLTRFRAVRADRFTIFASLFYVGALSFFAVANKMTTAANAIFLQYTAPVYILVFAPLVLGEKFKIRDLWTVVLCLAGMALFFVDSPEATAKAENPFLGDVLGLLSGVALGGYILLLRHPLAKNQHPAASGFYGNVISIFVMVPFVLSDPSEWTGLDLFAVAALGIVQIGLAYYLFTGGVARGVRSLDASIIGFVEPLLNPIWVVLFIGETPSVWAIAGGGVIIVAVLVHTLLSNRAAAAS
jgi:drug/metabolite transporter (DMT)-like permease